MTNNTNIDQLLNAMTLEEKIGQMLVLGFSGTYPHPDILRVIEEYHVAGFRVTPGSRKFIRELKPGSAGEPRVQRLPEADERTYGVKLPAPAISPQAYARVLNVLRQRALDTGAHIPLYFSLDYEGNQSIDYSTAGMVGFPHPMGIAQSGDPTLARRVAWAIGAQLKAVGINWIHSPVLDVNTDPANPEISTRSYSSDPDIVSEYGLQALYGFTDAGIIATGKHFPGRGHSGQDAHYDVNVTRESRARMDAVHLAPYRALIRAGLPAVMLAHSSFPALDPSGTVATVSQPIVSGVLRGELGFEGVVMTDSITMGGLANQYEIAEAAVLAVEAGVDLLLLKDENALRGEMYHALLDAVRTKRVSESRIHESARRVLAAKDRIGLLDGNCGMVDPDQVPARLFAPEHARIAIESAERSVVVARAQGGVLPLRPGTRVLVAEQVNALHRRLNDSTAYPGALAHALLERGLQVVYTDFDAGSFETAWKIVERHAPEVDVIVHTGYHERASANISGAGAAGHTALNPAHHERFLSLGLPTVFVANSPYPYLVSPQMPTVVVTFSSFAESMRAAADVLCGFLPARPLTFDPTQRY
jgi:beta-N-acetylhexosaminidase